jgi:catechol 2,3-dioxygenase-like lactoylglutathione lyase family enzyme
LDILMSAPEQRRVTGIGGIFFKASNPDQLREWYRRHLGVPIEEWGGTAFRWQSPDNPSGTGTTVWNIFDHDTKYFGPGPSPFMINFRVADLHGLVALLRAEGCNVDDKTDDSEYGKFGWVTDPEGNRVELWEPPAGQ